MKHLFVSIFIFIALIGGSFGGKEEDERFQKMVNKNGKGGLLVLSSKTLLSLVNAERNYSLVLYFGSAQKDGANKCEYCRVVEPQFKRLFYAYHSFVGGESSYRSSSFLNNPVFFATCNIPDCTEAAVLGGLETIPQISLLESKTKPKSDKKYSMDGYRFDGKVDVYSLASFLHEKTGLLVASKPFYEENMELIAYIGMGLGAIVLLPKIWSRRRDPMIWYCVALCSFSIVMAGTIYNAIRGAQFWAVSRDGSPIIFYPAAREQFVAEGYLMSFTITGMGLVVVGLNVLVPWFENIWIRRGLTIVHLGLFVIGFRFLRDITRKKYGHYPL